MTDSSASRKNCTRCGALLLDAHEGLCPRCLLAEAMQPTQAGDAVPPTPVPALEELAPHFPQLEILECLGRGGMGVVYKARQKSLNRLVALKLLAPERAGDPQFAVRFEKEAHALAALNHPHIVAVHDFGQAGGFFFLLMEFVDGVNLRQAMKAGRFTPEQALAVVPPVCEALQYAHEHGIVHRDIKPENLLLDKEGRVKIADFGIAKMLGADADTAAREAGPQAGTLASFAGTPQYMSPEQKAHGVTDHRADIYSLGVVLYELLTGELPADSLQPPSRKVQIDVRLDEIVLRALEKTPELRYQTAGEFRTQVETMVAENRNTGVPSVAGNGRSALGKCAFGLFLTGVLGAPLLLLLPKCTIELALQSGAVVLLLSLIFGLMSRRDRCGRMALIGNVVVAVLAGIFYVGQVLYMRQMHEGMYDHPVMESERQEGMKQGTSTSLDPAQPLESLSAAAKELIVKYFSDVQVRLEKDQFTASHATQEFQIHNRSKTGAAAADAVKETGPSVSGFILRISRKDDNEPSQAAVPQTLREPYWSTFINSGYHPTSKRGVWISYAFGSRPNAAFHQQILELLSLSAMGTDKSGAGTTLGVFNTTTTRPRPASIDPETRHGVSSPGSIVQLFPLLLFIVFLYFVYRVWRRYGWKPALLIVFAALVVVVLMTMEISSSSPRLVATLPDKPVQEGNANVSSPQKRWIANKPGGLEITGPVAGFTQAQLRGWVEKRWSTEYPKEIFEPLEWGEPEVIAPHDWVAIRVKYNWAASDKDKRILKHRYYSFTKTGDFVRTDYGDAQLEDDPIGRLTQKLNETHGLWINGLSPALDLPPTASNDEVLLRIISRSSLGNNIRTLEMRKDCLIQVINPKGDHFNAALVEVDVGKRIILFRREGDSWWSRVYELP